MSHILLVDDALDDQKIIQSALSKQNDLKIAASIAEARQLLAKEDFDLILLDVQLPDGDGFRFCADLQSDDATQHLPIIFLTARGDVSDKIMGFSLGAEDYVAKPFDPKELRARVDARLKKTQEKRSRELVLQLGSLRISISQQKAYSIGEGGEKTLDLTPLEFKLLFHFARHEDHVFTREQLLAAVWSDSVNVLDRTVDMHVSNLRKKLGPCTWTIRSVHGVGYRFTQQS